MTLSEKFQFAGIFIVFVFALLLICLMYIHHTRKSKSGGFDVHDGQRLYPVYRHKKSGGMYAYLGVGKLEANGERHVMYVPVGQLETAEPWLRPYNEFHDGRFERVGATNQ